MSWRINNWCSDPNTDPKNHHLACVYIIDVWIKVMTEWYLSVSLRDARFILTGKSGEWEHVDIRGSFVETLLTLAPGTPENWIHFFLFRMAQTISNCEVSYPADVFIGSASFSWCGECDIFAHTCTLFSALLVDTAESPQGKQADLLLLQQTPEPRGSATFHLMTSCGIKTERLRRAHKLRPA